jgi:hypothetical protein
MPLALSSHRFEFSLKGQPPQDSELRAGLLAQDYFDWEMAVTGITAMQEEIQRLQALVQPL